MLPCNYEEDNNKVPMNKPYNIQNTNICNGIFHISFFKALLINEGETTRGEKGIGAKRLRGQTGFGAKRPSTVKTWVYIYQTTFIGHQYMIGLFLPGLFTSNHTLLPLGTNLRTIFHFQNKVIRHTESEIANLATVRIVDVLLLVYVQQQQESVVLSIIRYRGALYSCPAIFEVPFYALLLIELPTPVAMQQQRINSQKMCHFI